MPPLLVLDIAGMALSLLLSTALALTVVGAGFRKPVNRSFVIFAVMESGWAFTSLLLRLSLWYHQGNAEVLLELASAFFAVMAPFLLLFCTRYVQLRRRWPIWILVGAMLVIEANAAFLFQARLVFDPVLGANGTLSYRFSPVGLAGTSAPTMCILLSLILLAGQYRRDRDPLMGLSVLFFFAGFIAGSVLLVPIPVMAITNTAGVGLMGWVIIRKQLFNPLRDLAVDLRERAHQQELVSQISRRTTTLLNLAELLDEAAHLIQSRFQYTAVAILLIDGEDLVMRAFTHPHDRERLNTLRLKVGREGISGWVAGTGVPLVVGDVRKEPRYVPGGAEGFTRSELAVPIRRGDRVIGVLDVQSAAVNAFNDKDVLTQQTVADQLSTSIENARLYEETQRRAERLAVVNRISSAAGSVLDLDDLLQTVYRELTPIFEADAFFIALFDAEENSVDFRILIDQGRRSTPIREPLGTGLTSRVIKERAPLLISDLMSLPKETPRPEMWGSGRMPGSWIGVPMLLGDRIIGVMSVQKYRRNAYDSDDLLLAGTIADQLAVAVENARLYQEVRQELDVRLRTEKVLRESEEKFRNLADQTPNMIFIWSAGRIVYANRHCELALGYPRKELYAMDVGTFADPDQLPRISENFTRHLRGEEVPPYECTVITRMGRRLDAILATKVISYDGAPAILGLVTDITTRKRTERFLKSLNAASLAMEQALTPSEVFPATISVLAELGFDSAILLTEPEGSRTLHMKYSGNGATGEIAPTASHSAGHRFDDFPALARAMDARKAVLAAMEPASPLAALFERSPPVGPLPQPCETILAPLVVGDSMYGLLAVSGADLSDADLPVFTAFAHQVAAAWRKMRLMGELEKSLEQLRQTQTQLLHAQKMEAVGRLAGGIAHDFNNLLTVISGYTSLMTDSMEGNEPALEDLGQIRTTIKRAAALTGRLLSFSRKQVLQPVVLDMNRVVSSSVSLLRPLIGEDIELIVKPGPAMLLVHADPYQMEQILMNLSVNARDAMPGGGTLTVQTGLVESGPTGHAPLDGTDPALIGQLPADLADGRWVILRVQDTGIGMNEETRSRIFEPFFTTKEEGKGSGLGLSTVYGIVTQTGGSVRVDTDLGRGSTFVVCLPLAQSDHATASEDDRAPALPSGSGTVLLVEDEPGVRQLARRVLERGGYNVIPVISAREALLVAEGSAVLDLVITDVVMPGGMSGIEMGERLSRTRPTLPVLYMSGYTSDLQLPAVSDSSQVPFLGKPFQPDQLLSKVKEMVGNRGA
jgi:PAS domain S-box-containing protein